MVELVPTNMDYVKQKTPPKKVWIAYSEYYKLIYNETFKTSKLNNNKKE